MPVVHIRKKLSLNLRPTAKLVLYCDGKKVDTLEGNRLGAEISVDKDSSIWVKHQWCGSNKLKISGDDADLIVESFLSDKLFVVILSLVLLFTLLTIFAQWYFFAFFSLIILAYPLYYITFGRNSYLKIRQPRKLFYKNQ